MSRIEIGTEVYDDEGNEVGIVKGFTSSGFVVSTDENAELGGVSETNPARGQPELLWRCAECGDIGEMEGELPDSCPSCGAPKTDLYYWTEAYD